MKPTVTEQTGKRYKGRMLLGGLGACLGVVLMIAEVQPAGVLILLAGLALYAAGRFGAWWNHG